MDFNGLLGVVVGLCALYWIVASASSFVVDVLSSFRNIRARGLELFAKQMLAGPEVPAKLPERSADLPHERPVAEPLSKAVATLADLDVMDHPLIRRLFKPGYFIEQDTAPTYVPAALFAKALLDRIGQVFGGHLRAVRAAAALHDQLQVESPAVWSASRQGVVSEAVQALNSSDAWSLVLAAVEEAYPGVELPEALALAAQGLPEPHRSIALRIAMDPAPPSPALNWPAGAASVGTRALTAADLRVIIESGRLPAALGAALRPILDAANHDIDALRSGIEGWYDSVMDRATGWFRRHAQLWLFFVALLVAIAFNLDTLYVARSLATDPAAREAATQLGQRIVRNGGDDASTIVQQYAFWAAFGDGSWEERASAGSDRSSSVDAVAQRVQPLLLASGSLVGPMLTLQADALETLRRCGQIEKDCEPPPDWIDHRDALVGAACRVQLGRSTTPSADKDKAARSSDLELGRAANATGHAAERDACSAAHGLVTADQGPVATLDSLWSSSLVVWHTDLGKTAWAVRKDMMENSIVRSTTQDVVAFKAAMRDALARAHEGLGSIDVLMARLERLGSVSKAWDVWRGEPHDRTSCISPLAVGTSLLGWLITGFMASLGAPLWFDLLNKVTNRRIAGPKPAGGSSES